MAKQLAIGRSILQEMNEAQRERIRKAAPAYDVVELETAGDLDKIEIVFGGVPYEMSVKMPNLRWVQLRSAGVETRNDKSQYPHPDFQLTNATGAYGLPIAEHILAMMLGMQRGLHLYRDHQNKHEWKEEPIHFNFAGSSVAIVGMGDIGRETAKRCKALGARVLGIKRTPCAKPDYVDELHFDLDTSLDAVLAQAQFVALCLPHTTKTRGLIDARRLALLPDNAILINIGRGALIDQQALTAELCSGRINAALDVTQPEPLPVDNALWSLPNCWITPHMAGRDADRAEQILDIFLRNLQKFISGEELFNVVDFNEGY